MPDTVSDTVAHQKKTTASGENRHNAVMITAAPPPPTFTIDLWAVVGDGFIKDHDSGDLGRARLAEKHRRGIRRGRLAIVPIDSMEWCDTREGWSAFGHAGPWKITRLTGNGVMLAVGLKTDDAEPEPVGEFLGKQEAVDFAHAIDDHHRAKMILAETVARLIVEKENGPADGS